MRFPRVALMILNFNGLPYLRDCLDSVSWSTYPNLDVYVIDNGSTDDSCKLVTSNYPRAKLIRFDANVGFAKAYDIAVKGIEADYVLLLNNDTQVQMNFVEVLVERAESGERVGSVGCKIVQPGSPRRYGPVFFSGSGRFIGPLFFGSTIEKDAVQSIYATEAECLANSAAAVLYRKSLIDAIGLFDSDFWADWEDHDLGFRICLAGFRNLYTPRTIVLHKGAASFGSVDSRGRAVRMIRNMFFTYVKNYDARNIALRFFPLFFVIYPYRELIVILENELGLLLGRDSGRRAKLRTTYMAYAVSCWQFIRELRHVMEKRGVVQLLRRSSDEDIIRRTSKPLI